MDIIFSASIVTSCLFFNSFLVSLQGKEWRGISLLLTSLHYTSVYYFLLSYSLAQLHLFAADTLIIVCNESTVAADTVYTDCDILFVSFVSLL